MAALAHLGPWARSARQGGHVPGAWPPVRAEGNQLPMRAVPIGKLLSASRALAPNYGQYRRSARNAFDTRHPPANPSPGRPPAGGDEPYEH